jgi:diacylglycerol O-acyltransferase / wax synthase
MDRLSPLDASFLHIEDDANHMHIGSIGIFEGPAPDYRELTRTIAGRLHLVPRYRQKVATVPLALARPTWVDDPHFNIEYHVRHTALPPPGNEDALRRLVGRVMSQKLDRGKALWEIWMVEGLDDGKWSLVSKVHHCLVDGVSGAELLAVILDLSPEVPAPVDDGWRPAPEPSALDLTRDAAIRFATSPYEQVRAATSLLRRPQRLLDSAKEVAKGSVALSHIVRPTPPTSLNGPISPHRRYEWTTARLSDVKAIRAAHGGTVNDIVLALVTRGFRNLLLSRGEDPDGRVIRTLVPVSVRPRGADGTAAGDGTMQNKVSAMFAELPVGLDDPVERLHAIRDQLTDLKQSKQALAGEALTSASGFAPATLLTLGTRVATRAARRMGNLDTVTTNVPGPQFPLYSCGRRLLRALPYVPLAAPLRVGVAIFSYDGELTFGVTGDYDTAADIGVLARGVSDGIDELLDQNGHRTSAEAEDRASPSPPPSGNGDASAGDGGVLTTPSGNGQDLADAPPPSSAGDDRPPTSPAPSERAAEKSAVGPTAREKTIGSGAADGKNATDGRKATGAGSRTTAKAKKATTRKPAKASTTTKAGTTKAGTTKTGTTKTGTTKTGTTKTGTTKTGTTKTGTPAKTGTSKTGTAAKAAAKAKKASPSP